MLLLHNCTFKVYILCYIIFAICVDVPSMLPSPNLGRFYIHPLRSMQLSIKRSTMSMPLSMSPVQHIKEELTWCENLTKPLGEILQAGYTRFSISRYTLVLN